MDLQRKLEILADAAKYDASCASSGAVRKDSRGGAGVGSTGGAGICHSYAPDGRCISLLKVLLTNACLYDCLYCINRRSSNVQRAGFTPDEVVRLTLDFYKRNFIEGLFLSSGIIRSADYTMELVLEVARKLREEHHFRGYIHLKTIPEASPALIERAGRYADRISLNIELPTQTGLTRLAPQKNLARTQEAMAHIRGNIEERHAEKRKPDAPKPPPFATGQSTQMLVGADDSTDAVILRRADVLYSDYYRSIFNPARLKVRAMQAEMPKKYWKNLPEASLIADLISGSGGRVQKMLRTEARPAKSAPKNEFLDSPREMNAPMPPPEAPSQNP